MHAVAAKLERARLGRAAMRFRRPTFVRSALGAAGALILVGASACGRKSLEASARSDSGAAPSVSAAVDEPHRPSDAGSAKLGAVDLQVNVYSRPDPTSPRCGYLRLGTIVDRDEKPAGNDRCPGGWYRVEPRG